MQIFLLKSHSVTYLISKHCIHNSYVACLLIQWRKGLFEESALSSQSEQFEKLAGKKPTL